MKRPAVLLALAALLLVPGTPAVTQDAEKVKPLQALLICGGCCHDYVKQKDLLKAGIEARAHVEVTIVYNPDKSTKARFELYENPDWAKPYDVIIHDECSASVTEMPYVNNILAAHRQGKPGVNLHCAMHSYRIKGSDWFDYVGVQSSRHGPKKPIEIQHVDKKHPILDGLPEWKTINEELYNNIKVLPTATPLSRGKQDTGKKVDDYVVTWTNEYGKARVFSTTLGHNTETVADDRYLDLVTRGLLWSCDKLNDTYLKK